ncbi:MAG TPA: hypothetical protein VHL58_04180 [Thermoanaerobaculia bacterium]|nr:hypothetical protein [Thermoanaerobaculia bacterium]
MPRSSKARRALYSLFSILMVAGAAGKLLAAGKESKQWTERFNVASCNWSSTGKNDYFILEPGYQQTFEGHEGKTALRLVITVLTDTEKIAGVETRVVEERESHGGVLVEISRNYFAVCQRTNDVFYFGEDVDMYKNGKLSDHEGSWRAGQAGAKAGLFMPATALLGARFYQEIAKGVALDRTEIASDSETLKTPAGDFHDCVKTEETTPLEPGIKEYKIYAPGVGLVQDGELFLTKYGLNSNGK